MEPFSSSDQGSLAGFLRTRRDQILARWQVLVRPLPPARELSERELLDHLPELLDRIAGMVEDLEHGQPIRGTGKVADVHAIERLEEGYDLEQVVSEFVALRLCVLELLAKEPQRASGSLVLNRAIDEAVMAAVSKYTNARERTLVALDRIAAATLDSPNVGTLLRALTDVLLQTTAAVDSVAIYLREGKQLLLRAAVGLEEHLTDREVVEIGSPTCAGRIAATGKPLELRDAANHPLVSEPLREGHTRAFYGVPMRQHGEVMGVAHITSRTAFEFSKEDKLVFRSMVERATTAVSQRQLQDQVQVERSALEEERQRLETVLEMLPVGVFVSDEKGGLLRINAMAKEFWGPDVPLVGSPQEYGHYKAWRPGGELLRPEEWGLSQALETGRPSPEQELEVETFHKQRKTMLNYAAPVRRHDGTVIGGVAVNVDITERRRAERERAALLQRERQLRSTAEEALAMLDGFFTDAPIGLAFLDTECRYVRINNTLAAVNGLSAQEHVGKAVHEVLPAQGELLENLLRQVLDSGRGLTGLEYSLATPMKPDQVREWQLNLYPVRLANGTVLGVAVAVIEITPLKEAVRARDEFLSVASHDLRSPLAAMRLQVDSVLRKAAPETFDGPFVMRKLQKIRKQIDRVTGLLDDLLDVSKLQAGRLNLDLEEVDFALLVRDVAARHEELLASSGCELRLDVEGSVVGRWDPLRLEQIVANLLSNALKYGAGHPVTIRLHAEKDKAILQVEDQGVGIAPANLQRIFERFERVGDREAFAGTGVGLWIVKRFVEAMGGCISVKSTPGAGSTFTVELPRAV